jgi:hypothetical protein
MSAILIILVYVLGMGITFVVSFIEVYKEGKNKKAMLPNIASVVSKISVIDRRLIYISCFIWPIYIVWRIVLGIGGFIVKLPQFIIELTLPVLKINQNKILKGKIALLKVGEIMKVVRYDFIKDFETIVIDEITDDSIVLHNGIEIPKEHIVLVDDDLYALMRPYKQYSS